MHASNDSSLLDILYTNKLMDVYWTTCLICELANSAHKLDKSWTGQLGVNSQIGQLMDAATNSTGSLVVIGNMSP